MVKLFQMDPITVKDLGQAVITAAQDTQHSTDPQALDNFKSDIDKIVPTAPKILQGTLTTFNTNFYKAYSDVLTQRTDIGKALMGASDATIANEINTVNMFTDVPPTVLV